MILLRQKGYENLTALQTIYVSTRQGGHILVKMKFPVFSCVTEIFPVLFLRKN